MAYDAEWSEDFCLFCDAQISRGAYCSEVCRQADRRSSTSTTHQHKPSRTDSIAGSTASSWTTNAAAQARNAAYSLPSGFTFPQRTSTQSSSSTGSSRQPSPGEMQDPSKRFSVSSIDSPASESPYTLSRSFGGFNASTGLSEHAVRELRQYESSFDQTRNHRMRAYGSR